MFTGSGPIFKIKFAVTAFRKSSTEYSGSVPENATIFDDNSLFDDNDDNGLFDDNDDSPIRYGFIVICSDSAECVI